MEHLNNSISAGERSSTFLSSSAAAAGGAVSVPGSGRVQGSRAPEGRAKSRPHKQRQKHQQQPRLPQASALVVPVGSSDSEGQYHSSNNEQVQYWATVHSLQLKIFAG